MSAASELNQIPDPGMSLADGFAVDGSDSSMPLISFIVPVYKTQPELFASCLESLCLSDTRVEACIVFDGNPSFELERIAKEKQASCRVKAVIQENAGVSAARNAGIDLAEGHWLSFVDADDLLPAGAIDAFLQAQGADDSDIIMGAHEVLYPNGRRERREYPHASGKYSVEEIERLRHDVLEPSKNAGLVWGKLYRRAFIEANRLRFNNALSVAEDTDFVFRSLLKTNGVSSTNDCVYLYRRVESSATTGWKEDYPKRIFDSMSIMKQQIDSLGNGGDYQSIFADYVVFHLMLILVHNLSNVKAPWSLHRRREEFNRTLNIDIFSWALDHCTPKAFSLSKRCALFCLQHRLFLPCMLIGAVRQYQIR